MSQKTRKDECESIVLTKAENKLLRRIKRHPHLKCDEKVVQPLCAMKLVKPDTKTVKGFGYPFPADTYCVTDFYFVYEGYCKEKWLLVFAQGFWLPFGVSVITNLISVGIQWLFRLQ